MRSAWNPCVFRRVLVATRRGIRARHGHSIKRRGTPTPLRSLEAGRVGSPGRWAVGPGPHQQGDRAPPTNENRTKEAGGGAGAPPTRRPRPADEREQNQGGGRWGRGPTNKETAPRRRTRTEPRRRAV